VWVCGASGSFDVAEHAAGVGTVCIDVGAACGQSLRVSGISKDEQRPRQP